MLASGCVEYQASKDRIPLGSTPGGFLSAGLIKRSAPVDAEALEFQRRMTAPQPSTLDRIKMADLLGSGCT
jgi:hypothetical protein